MDTKVNTIGFTLTHPAGSCEVALQFFADKPQVYVLRDKKDKILSGNGDLDAVIKTGKVTTSKGKRIVLNAYEQEFIAKLKPVFDELEKVNVDKICEHILEGG